MTATDLDLITLRVSEVFGPTWQGEGPHAGRRCHFLRLGLCNLSCEWCDTPYTWDATRFDLTETCPPTPATKVRDQLTEAGATLVVVSGGEPLMHARQLEHLTGSLPEVEWHVESNGTITPPDWWGDRFAHSTVSPKVGTHDRYSKRIKLGPLAAWAGLAAQGKAAFKFVARDPAEVAEAAAVVASAGLDPATVWIMPEGTTALRVLQTHRTIAGTVADAGFNTTTRLHTLLWDDERLR